MIVFHPFGHVVPFSFFFRRELGLRGGFRRVYHGGSEVTSWPETWAGEVKIGEGRNGEERSEGEAKYEDECHCAYSESFESPSPQQHAGRF